MNDYKYELELIRQKNSGILNPHDVVEYASDPTTALHSRFEWNDEKAGHEYRVWQARQLIRVIVIQSPRDNTVTQCYVSLSDERGKDGGYRAVVEVLDNKALTARLLQDALDELTVFREKYAALDKISKMRNLFAAMDKVFPERKAKKVEKRNVKSSQQKQSAGLA